jgi:hypothetical protein
MVCSAATEPFLQHSSEPIFGQWIVSFAPQAAQGLDGNGKISGTRFLCKKPVPEPSGKNSYIFTVNTKCSDLSCAGAPMSHFSSLRRNRMGVFRKRVQGENPFAKGFSPWTLFLKVIYHPTKRS